jgi:hypothetical protein
MFLAEVSGKEKHDNGLKSGYTRMTLVGEIPVPAITTEQCVRFGILCSLKVYNDKEYQKWAEDWLSGKDRSPDAAEAAARAAEAAAEAARAAGAAAWAAARASAWAAEAAARAVEDGGYLDLPAIAREACGDGAYVLPML